MNTTKARDAGIFETQGNVTGAVAETLFGPILVLATERGILQIHFGDRESELLERLATAWPRVAEDPGDRLQLWLGEIVNRIDSPGKQALTPLDVRGTPFQRRVWDELLATHLGETLTYVALAERIGKPTAVRAVANACAANELAVVIPCHRVLRTDGGLGGYRWGMERKRQLLEREASAMQCS